LKRNEKHFVRHIVDRFVRNAKIDIGYQLALVVGVFARTI
jgi:hypothetical protein